MYGFINVTVQILPDRAILPRFVLPSRKEYDGVCTIDRFLTVICMGDPWVESTTLRRVRNDIITSYTCYTDPSITKDRVGRTKFI